MQQGGVQSVPEGLLPPAAELEHLERIFPGITARILSQWERRLEHQRDIENRGLTYAREMAFTGFAVGLILGLAGIITHQAAGIWAGGAVGTIDIVALVTVFIRGRST